MPRVHRKTTRYDGRGRWQAGTRRSELPLYLEQDVDDDTTTPIAMPLMSDEEGAEYARQEMLDARYPTTDVHQG